MTKKTKAQLILMGLALIICGTIYGIIQKTKPPDAVVTDGVYHHRKLNFEFRVPRGWTVQEKVDPRVAKLIARKTGRTQAMDADSYLPVFAMDYEIVRLNLANIVLKKMTDTVAVVKTESDSFSDVQIEQRTRLKYPKFDDEGHLVYSFFGVSGGNRQITEKRFLLKGNILITLTLSDFEGTFSNKALDDVEASLTFVTPARSPKTS